MGSGALEGESSASVALMTSPFEAVGSGIDAVPYLAPDSPCRDSGVSSVSYSEMRDWQFRTTTADGAPDVTPAGMGYHWPLPRCVTQALREMEHDRSRPE